MRRSLVILAIIGVALLATIWFTVGNPFPRPSPQPSPTAHPTQQPEIVAASAIWYNVLQRINDPHSHRGSTFMLHHSLRHLPLDVQGNPIPAAMAAPLHFDSLDSDSFDVDQSLYPSPNGRYLFVQTHGLGPGYGDEYVYDMRSGELHTLTNIDGPFYGWHPDSRHVLLGPAVAGDRPLTVLNVETNEHTPLQPSYKPYGAAFSPDGQQVAFIDHGETQEVHETIAWPDGLTDTVTHRISSFFLFISPTHGDPPPPAAQVLQTDGGYLFGWSPDGRYLLHTGGPGATQERAESAGPFWLHAADGSNPRNLPGPPLVGPYGSYFQPQWSPDSQWIAYSGRDPGMVDACQPPPGASPARGCEFEGAGIYIVNVHTKEVRRLAAGIRPVWSPDGSRLAFVSKHSTSGIHSIWTAHINGADRRQLATVGPDKEIDTLIWLAENEERQDRMSPRLRPQAARVLSSSTAPFLSSPFYGKEELNQGYARRHPAHDYDLAYVPVLAAADGSITRVRWNHQTCHDGTACGFGLYIKITHANGYSTWYAHLAAAAFPINEIDYPIGRFPVKRGQIIGTSGNTGWSSGPHLHFEVRTPNGVRVDPSRRTANLWLPGHPAISTHRGTRPIPKPAQSEDIRAVTIDDQNANTQNFMKTNTWTYDTTIGNDRDMHWTRVTSTAMSTSQARWRMRNFSMRPYEVLVYIPARNGTSWQAPYHFKAKTSNGIIDQYGISNKWVSLGMHFMSPSSTADGYINLHNATGEGTPGRNTYCHRTPGICKVGADAVQFVPLGKMTTTSISPLSSIKIHNDNNTPGWFYLHFQNSTGTTVCSEIRLLYLEPKKASQPYSCDHSSVTQAVVSGSENLRVSVLPPPVQPTALMADASAPGRITLTWTVPSNADPSTKYDILRREERPGTSYESIAIVTDTTYQDTTVSAGATYLYRVQSINTHDIRGPWSDPYVRVTALLRCSDRQGAEECDILIKAKNTLRGSASLNWSRDIPLNQWDGVTVSHSHVTKLDLSGRTLSGNIPSQLGSLAQLQYLYLHENQLTGGIPAQLGNLTQLQHLILWKNQLTGPIPVELGNLTKLQWLYLNVNQLTGTIPIQLGNLTNLQDLGLSRNQLTGPIPVALSNLTKLQHLNVWENQLTGSIPMELGNLATLQYLYLSDNQLSGCIPRALRTVPTNDLRRLKISYCE